MPKKKDTSVAKIEAIRTAWKAVKAALEAIPSDDATTTTHFWDCECEDRHIHSREDFSCLDCHIEEPEVYNQPDSRLREVMLMLMEQAEVGK